MIEFMDGFDHYETLDILRKWTSASFTPAAGTTYPGVSSVWALGQGQGFKTIQNNTISKSVNNLKTGIVGCYINLINSAGGTCTLMRFMQGSTEHCSLRFTAGGYFTFTRNGTVLATSTNPVPFKQWFHLEVKATIGDSDGAYEVRINGTSTGWLSGSGADTQNGGSAYFDTLTMASDNNSSSIYTLDDFYILNTTAPAPVDFIGPHKIFTIYPAKEGSNAGWTPGYLSANHSNVNEPISDYDGSFNYASGSAGAIDSFDFQDLAVSGSITAINTIINAKQDAGSARSVSDYVLFSGSAFSGSAVNTSASYGWIQTKRITDPAGNPWTAANINAAEFGYKRVT